VPDPVTDNARRRQRLIAVVALAAVALLYAEFIRHAVKYADNPADHTKGDFLAFYDAAKAMVGRGDLYVPRHRNYIYPPLVAFLYMPLTVFDDPPTLHRTAGLITLLLSAAMSVATVWMLARESLRRLAPAAAAAVVPLVMLLTVLIVGDKVRTELRMWQTNALMLFLMALGLWGLDKRPTWAGVALGLAVNVKYLPIFFLPYLLVRRRFRAAAGMVLGILAGAFAPALWVGWSKNMEYLRVGSRGLLALVGLDPGGQKAMTEDIAGGLSVSLTSVFARALGGADHAVGALAISAVLALALCAGIAVLYRRNRLPLVAWPARTGQSEPPYSSLVMIECSALILGLLIFSPQTNPRHLHLLLLPAAAGATIIVKPAVQGLRLPMIIAAVALLGSLVLPPGGTERLNAAVEWWRGNGGPSYGMLVFMAVLVWAGTKTARALAFRSNRRTQGSVSGAASGSGASA